MSATDALREDHRHIRRLERIVDSCRGALYSGDCVPPEDVRRIAVVISEFVEAVHYPREEDSYFACVAGYGTLREEIRKFMIEHEFGRRIAKKMVEHLDGWDGGRRSREPVARYLRTYSMYLKDHLAKEDAFFERSEGVLHPDEEREMYEQFRSVVAVSRRLDEVLREMDALERRPWCRGQSA